MNKVVAEAKTATKKPIRPKKYYIKTYGCQMNTADSEYLAGMLAGLGFKETSRYNEADLLIVNTCSVRQAAEDKVYGLAPKVYALKEQNPQALVIIIGCMVGSVRGPRKRYREAELRKKIPWANFLIETKEIKNLPVLLLKLGLISKAASIAPKKFEPKRRDKKQAYINISNGCDNFCAFCVVPFARGAEKSRNFEEIVCEVENLGRRGYEHITFVGQNVNSWGIGDRKQKLKIRTNSSELLPFAALLRRIHAIRGIKKIGFISANPFDFTQDLVKTLALPKIDRYLHMAIQSGDDEILKMMNRRHTVADVKELIKYIRKTVPDIKLGTDFIVGFPSETEEQFLNTVKLCQEIKFSVAYIAMYSERPGTLAARLYRDDVPKAVKRRRHAYLTKVVEENKPVENIYE